MTEQILSNPANKKKVVLPNDFSNGVTLHEDFIVIKNNEKIRILSSRCTHLGCRINNVNENILTCPCHGSQFDLNGIPVKGPAAKNLTELKFKIDLKQNQIIIFT
ncbi:ubiquinol-cytochrome c reductase iron-sulfur subunit [Ignavibacterium album]|uniref:QcrA and Rieske domain-containing protein n=1 Tax=Ignavibacterium album TaxID=591197 RepID=UPI0035B866E9